MTITPLHDIPASPPAVAVVFDRRTGKALMRCISSNPGPAATNRHLSRALDIVNALAVTATPYTRDDLALIYLPKDTARRAMNGEIDMAFVETEA